MINETNAKKFCKDEIIKAIFDGKLFAAKDPKDEYDEDYVDYINGYEIR